MRKRIPVVIRWDEKGGLRRDAVCSQAFDVLKSFALIDLYPLSRSWLNPAIAQLWKQRTPRRTSDSL